MSNTYPEGITPPPFPPQPYDYAKPPEQLVGSKSFLMTVSVIIGIVVGVGIIVGGIGKYVYVERPDYYLKMGEIDRSTVTMADGIKNINQSQYHFEAAIDRIESALGRQATDIQVIKIEIARGKR